MTIWKQFHHNVCLVASQAQGSFQLLLKNMWYGTSSKRFCLRILENTLASEMFASGWISNVVFLVHFSKVWPSSQQLVPHPASAAAACRPLRVRGGQPHLRHRRARLQQRAGLGGALQPTHQHVGICVTSEERGMSFQDWTMKKKWYFYSPHDGATYSPHTWSARSLSLSINTSPTFNPGVCSCGCSGGWEDLHSVWPSWNGVPERDLLFWPCSQSLDTVCRGTSGAGMAWHGCC